MISDETKNSAALITEVDELRQQVALLKEELARYQVSTPKIRPKGVKTGQEETQLQQQLREQQMMLQISQIIGSSLELHTILQQIADAAASLIDRADIAVIHLVDETQTYLTAVAVSGMNVRPYAQRMNFIVGEGIAGAVLSSGLPIYLPDAPSDPRYIPGKSTERRVRSLLVAPIKAEKECLGTLSVHSKNPGMFTADDERLLSILGNQAALALSRSQMFDATQRRLKEVNTLFNITQRITETFDIDVLLLQVVDLLQEFFGFYHVHIYLIDPETGDLIMRQGSGEIGARLKDISHRLRAGVGIVGYAVGTGQPYMTNNVKGTPFFIPNPLLPDTTAELAIPLRTGERTLGAIDIQHRGSQLFTKSDVTLMTAVANQVAVAIERVGIHSDLQAALVHEQTTRAQLVQSEKLAALGRIVASVAHELNNPLQAIQNALYLIKLSDSLDDQSREDLKVALNEASRMADLISRLRETYRPTAGEEFHFESINSVIDEVQKLISTHLRHHSITFSYDPDQSMPLVPIIRDQIKQVVLNLCLNAVEAMENGGDLTVRTRFNEDLQVIALIVTDTGPGIPPNVLPYIFDPFVTTKPGGTGLGLAITYDIVRRHHGQIDVDSKIGEGTMFTVLLPLKQT